MKGLIEEGCEKIDLPEGSARDASLICAAQKVQHYEIAGYGSVRAFALQVGQHKIATLLEMTLDEEAETYHKLTEIAERIDPLAESVEACPIISQRFLTMQCDDIDLQLVGNRCV